MKASICPLLLYLAKLATCSMVLCLATPELRAQQQLVSSSSLPTSVYDLPMVTGVANGGARVGAAAIVLTPVAVAQEEPDAITTERPTFGYSPDTIPAGSIQVENGINVGAQRHLAEFDGPESLVRFGFTKHVELRVLSSNYAYQSSTGRGVNRLQGQDMGISSKILISAPNSFAPKTAVVGFSLPTGGPSFTSNSYDPSLAAIWTQAFPRGYFTNEVAQATLTTFEGARRPTWAPSVVVGRNLSDRLSIFVEYAPTVLTDHTAIYAIDGGFAYLPRKLRQIDVRAGYLKDEQGVHTLVSLGYSVRLDHAWPIGR